MRAAALHFEQRRVIDTGLIDLARVLSNQLTDHLQMAEFFHRNVLQHIADAGILDMEGLHPILQRSGELAGRAAKLLQQESAEACIWLADLDRLDQFFLMEEHGIILWRRNRAGRSAFAATASNRTVYPETSDVSGCCRDQIPGRLE